MATAELVWCVQINGIVVRVLFPVRGRTGSINAAPHPGKRRVIARVRTPVCASFYCACASGRRRPVRRSPRLISYAFLICRHFARRVRRVLRGSAVIIYVYIIFFSAPRSTLYVSPRYSQPSALAPNGPNTGFGRRNRCKCRFYFSNTQ